MSYAPQGPLTTGSSTFDPDVLFAQWSSHPRPLPQNNDLRSSIIRTFSLPHNDEYTYHAIASVTLPQVQQTIDHGREAGLHAWYRDGEGRTLEPPPKPDIKAYTSLFSPSTTPNKALTTFASNAKRNSIRAISAAYLQSHRHLPSSLTIPRCKAHINPALDFWTWSCECLEWAGPTPSTEKVPSSHHVLPVFMHHFGCVVPSFEALEIIKQTSKGREVVDMGSGNGYWTYMLRRHEIIVRAVDNMQSLWRTMWVGDTITEDGPTYLNGRKGCKDSLLLLVYPIVGLEFTAKVIRAYDGETIIVAATQNRSGYTAFKNLKIDEWMERERGEFRKIAQVPLPSFAAKDETLFVFERQRAR